MCKAFLSPRLKKFLQKAPKVPLEVCAMDLISRQIPEVVDAAEKDKENLQKYI